MGRQSFRPATLPDLFEQPCLFDSVLRQQRQRVWLPLFRAPLETIAFNELTFCPDMPTHIIPPKWLFVYMIVLGSIEALRILFA